MLLTSNAHDVMSPPVRGRGLKHIIRYKGRGLYVSPPVRGRGLKQVLQQADEGHAESPPVRGRGLKLSGDWHSPPTNCRPPCGGVD